MVSHWIKAQDGKEYPVRFSNAIYTQLAIKEGVAANLISKFFSSFQSWPIERVYRFYYLAFRYGAKKENREFEMNEEDFVDFVAEDDTIMPQIMKIMAASNPDPQKKTKANR
jgi:hypothetical protein